MHPDSFHVSAFYEQGVNGYVLNVHVYERVEGIPRIGLSGGFIFDLQCLPALKAELDRVFDKATQDGLFNNDNDDHGHPNAKGGDRD